MFLFKWKRGVLSENPLAVNALTSPKNSWNLQKRTFILIFHHIGQNWVTKSCFYSDLRFQDFLLTRWLPTSSIVIVIETLYRYQFKSNYLKSQKFFSNFFFWLLFAFSASAIYLQRSEKNMSLVGQVFAKLLTPNFVFI